MIVPSTAAARTITDLYHEYGVVQVTGLLDADDLAELREGVRDVIFARARAAGVGRVPITNDLDVIFNALCENGRAIGGDVYRVLRQHPVAVRLLTDRKITDVVRCLISPAVGPMPSLLYVGTDKLHFRIDRRGEDQYALPWHQDFPYICTTTRGVVAWYCLTDVTPEMGPMRVIQRSHKFGMLPTRIDPNYRNQFDHNRLFSLVSVDESRAIDLPAKAGDVIFMSVLTVHASGVNTSDKNRWSVVSRYDDLLDPEFVARGWRSGIDGASKTVTVLETVHAGAIVNRGEVDGYL